ncbi:M20/M25/M40 family metallo-hydrolase [Paraconexibacter antarcticus]|uniref:M20/M25/M40 family metallo-hydrolase n=1 Tax=Paraconexibacter antarcticus TaxID=2949664 RepID=A0ABY5DUJ2_9ACTN|nr:M20/M25/M40 family metallo-hydrolase [Paraconexibacter antarcticus]UTI64502.1 M20/M25/M40 family metallo-hydrolase [Paraconexibacter antarcticus]
MERLATALLQQLIRCNTVNPPGNERPAQEILAAELEGAGFGGITMVGSSEERPNLVARLKGKADGPTLCLLSHVDTVLASPADWEHDPWSGTVDDEGFLWGRGALDMKSQTAAEVAAAASLAASGWRPARGELLIVSVADEETGGSQGAQWICEHHPDLVRCDELLNEGGGPVIPFEGGRYYGVCVAEKGVFRFTITTDGVAGHASIPKMGDNALLKLAPFLQLMADRQPGLDLTDGPRGMLEGLGIPVDGDPAGALAELQRRDPVLGMLVEPMLGVSLAPTRISASEKINVIPARAEIRVDCRVPPGLGADVAERRIREVLGHDGYRLDFTEQVPGNASPVDTDLFRAIEGWVGREDPEAKVIPTILAGFTDSRTFRRTFPDCVAYGFFPHRHQTLYETAPLVHSANERIDVRDLGFATRCYAEIIKERLGEDVR